MGQANQVPEPTRCSPCAALCCCLQGDLASCGARCEQLQAQLDAAERRAAVLAAGQGPSLPELEGMLRRLTAQRDTAQVAAAEAQAKLSLREAELQQLRQQLRQQAGDESSLHFSWPNSLSSECLPAQQHGPAAATAATCSVRKLILYD